MLNCWARWRAVNGHLVGRDVSGRFLEDVVPFGCVHGCVCFEVVFMGGVHGDADFALRYIFAFDGEFSAVEGANYTVGEVEAYFWRWVFGEIVVGLEFVEEFGGRDYVVVCFELSHNLGFAF